MEEWHDKSKEVLASSGIKLGEGKYMGEMNADKGYFSKACYANSSDKNLLWLRVSS